MPLVFLNLSSIDVLGRIIHCSEGCTVHCRMFSNIPGFYPLKASSIPFPLSQMWQPKMSSGFARHPPGVGDGEGWSLVENHSLIQYLSGWFFSFLFWYYVPWWSVLHVSCLGVLWTIWICEFIVSIQFGYFSAIISSNTSLLLLLLL